MVGDSCIWILDEDSGPNEWIINNDLNLMQSTGLTDSAGKEIFEGDILKTTDYFSRQYLVEYDLSKAMFVAQEIAAVLKGEPEPLCELLNKDFTVKIIGDIHTNPELAEVSSWVLNTNIPDWPRNYINGWSVNMRNWEKHTKKGSYKQFFQEVKQYNESQARIIYQAFNSAVVERARISPATVDRLEGIISDELFDDLQDYLSTHYTRGKTTKNAGLPEELFKRFQEEVEELRQEHPNNLNNYKDCDQKNANRTQNTLNLCYAEKATLTPLKTIQMEGLLSRELFSEIIDYVFNNYEWAERLDDEVNRITLEYRTKGKVGREKTTVRKALYKAYALGV